MEKRLGRGLGSLLGQTVQVEQEKGAHDLGIRQIQPNPYQPRTVFDVEALEELAASIRQHGLLQPVVVRVCGAGYQLIAGERRWRAAQLAGLSSLPAVVRRDVSDQQMLELALVENVQRRELDAIERARGYQQMIEQLQITQEEVARKVGLQRATVTNHLRLLELPLEIQESVSRGLVTMGHARALLGVRDRDGSRSLLERIVREDLSVRQVEELVRASTQPKSSPAEKEAVQASASSPAWIRSIEQRLQLALGTKVKIRNGAGYRGQIVVEYYGRDDIDRLVEALAPAEEL
jgi:ParB family transcriptional regulator, chromosome partitioning protein